MLQSRNAALLLMDAFGSTKKMKPRIGRCGGSGEGMNREESWEVHGATLKLLRRIMSRGYIVSVFRSSLVATLQGFI